MKPIVLIEKPSQFQRLVKALSEQPYIAIDTESNSFYAYFEKVCLIQISTVEEDYIIDPLMLRSIEALGEILGNPDIEKILHAPSNDIVGLKRDFGFRIRNLFDTALACKLLGCKQLGLARILQERFAVQLDKKWQRCDWGRRPLHEDQLEYARLDTHYLIALRHQLAADLQAQDLWETAREACDKLCEQEAQEKLFHPGAFINIRGARSLDSAGKAVLKDLYIYREKEAQQRDRAPFRILSNETLLRLARSRPHSMREFAGTKGLPHHYRKGHRAHDLLELINRNGDGMKKAEAKT